MRPTTRRGRSDRGDEVEGPSAGNRSSRLRRSCCGCDRRGAGSGAAAARALASAVGRSPGGPARRAGAAALVYALVHRHRPVGRRSVAADVRRHDVRSPGRPRGSVALTCADRRAPPRPRLEARPAEAPAATRGVARLVGRTRRAPVGLRARSRRDVLVRAVAAAAPGRPRARGARRGRDHVPAPCGAGAPASGRSGGAASYSPGSAEALSTRPAVAAGATRRERSSSRR